MIAAIVCGYNTDQKSIDRCIDSISMQSTKAARTIVSIQHDENRKYLPQNTFDTISGLDVSPDCIIACIDADDFLIDEDAFSIIENEYENNNDLLLTYGSYVNISSNKRGKFCGEYNECERFRQTEWRASHLKTFKLKLFKKLFVSSFMFNAGEWFKCCADRAMMIPMMEIAGHKRIKYIDWLLYCYDDTNPNGVWKTMKEESKRTRDYISSLPEYSFVGKI